MQNVKTWLVIGLGIAALAVLSGAFERFIGWDRKKSAAMNGILTIGLAIGGAYLAHSAGMIDGNTRNMVIAGGAAIGTYQLAGERLYDFGSDIAGRFSKGGTPAAPAAKPPASSSPGGAFGGSPGVAGATPTLDIGSILKDVGLAGAVPTTTAPSGPSTAGQGAVYNINVEAAKAVKPNVGIELGKAGIAAAGSVLASFLGSKGSDQDLVTLGNL